MGKHIIGRAVDYPVGSVNVVELEGRSIGVFHIKDAYYAIKNNCPHQGANLCDGTVQGIMLPSSPGEYVYGKEGEVIRCPWHGWEFDIITGESIFDPVKCKVRTMDL